MRKILTYIFILVSFPIFLFGQGDSIVLTADKLLLDDIQISKTTETKQQVFAATRSLKNLNDLPFTVYVITKKEIRDNNYRTLVDALKMQPGIRISQPGSGLDGETFLMRGLLGNSYTKILLNGNPIKPSVVRGMPIGAQIPIQQAERIEIIYGTSGTLFGADGAGGLINIVLEETERPVYTQANLSLGSNEFTNLDVSFGGRLGKRKNTLRYSLFGSYTFRGDLNIQHKNDTLFDPDKYFSGLIDFRSLQNFVGDSQGNLLLNDLPHQSRLVGINLDYRSMRLSIEAMYRRDHSSIGLNPSAVSYTNPLNYIGERIINANFSIEKNFRKIGFEWRVNYLQYQMDNRSSHDYIVNSTSGLLDILTRLEATQNGVLDVAEYDSLSNWHFNRYFNGTRFSYSESADIGNSFVLYYHAKKNLDFTFGVNSKYIRSVPIVSYSRVPLGSSIFKNTEAPTNNELSPFPIEELNGFELSSFAQMYWTSKRLTVTGGVQWYRNGEFQFYSFLSDQSSDIKTSTDFRIATSYKINSKWNFRASYGTAFRVPSAFYKASTFNIFLERDPVIQVAVNDLDPESTKAFELGFRWNSGKNNLFDISGFHTNTTNLVSYDVLDFSNEDNQFFIFSPGFYNYGQSEMTLYGLQMNYLYYSKVLDFGFNITYSRGNETVNNVEHKNVRQQPRMIRKTRIVIRPTQAISFTFDTVFNSKSTNRIGEFNYGDSPKFRTIDILANYNINRNFRVFFKTKNIFNREYAGLNASDTIDDLFYNPQEKFTFRLGMSYQID